VGRSEGRTKLIVSNKRVSSVKMAEWEVVVRGVIEEEMASEAWVVELDSTDVLLRSISEVSVVEERTTKVVETELAVWRRAVITSIACGIDEQGRSIHPQRLKLSPVSSTTTDVF
jgi:hypothetical protein